MDLHELRVAARLIDGLAKRALFAEKQMVALEGQCAEWQRIADDLKAERNALRSTTIDTATGHLLDAFGSLANEPRLGATDDEYRDRIVTKIHTIKLERDALRTECDDLRRVFSLVHGSLGIQQGEHIGNAIEALKKERDELRAQLDTERERHKQKTVDVPRAHPVKVGEYVKNDNGDVCQVHEVYADAEYLLNTGWTLEFENCTPCDPPASHDTPAGKQAAESAVKREPKPGDTVRLVRIPTPGLDFDGFIDFPWNTDWGVVGDVATVVATLAPPNLPVVAVRVSSGIVVWWPLSCVEIVEDAK